jgi:hypothetical protein
MLAPVLTAQDDLLGGLGVQERPHVSATVVSTALATGLYVQRLDLPLLKRGVESGLPTPPGTVAWVSLGDVGLFVPLPAHYVPCYHSYVCDRARDATGCASPLLPETFRRVREFPSDALTVRHRHASHAQKLHDHLT